MSNTYGIIDSNDCHIDVSLSEKGAKNYATRHGYNKVSIRYNGGYIVKVLAYKVQSKWVSL
jgi:hypothetical protein